MNENPCKRSSEFPMLSPRYQEIEKNNERSWYFNSPRTFEAYQSVGTLKPSVRGIVTVALGFRRPFAGNMSPSYGPKEEAINNIGRFYRELALDPSTGITPHDIMNTKMLYPQRPRIEKKPLQMLNVDECERTSDEFEPLVLPERADFIYTYDHDTILAARPADCPIVLATAETPKGRILMLTHFSWEVAADGTMQTMFDHYDQLGVQRESLQLFVTPGGHAESFPYTNYSEDPRQKFAHGDGLFMNVRPNKANPTHFDFEVDTPAFVYEELLANGVAPEQIYADTSDTSALHSGYSSHGRAIRSKIWENAPGLETNIRDIIIAKMK